MTLIMNGIVMTNNGKIEQIRVNTQEIQMGNGDGYQINISLGPHNNPNPNLGCAMEDLGRVVSLARGEVAQIYLKKKQL